MEQYHAKLHENREVLLEQYLVRGGSYHLISVQRTAQYFESIS